MKHILFSLFAAVVALLLAPTAQAQNNATQARAILDKTAKVVGRSGGVSASFTMNAPSTGSISGKISVKGNKFYASTPPTTVWFNGKTQWTYMKKNNEVNVSTPTAAQQQMMNPYTFINVYKSGYKLSTKRRRRAANKNHSIQEMYITVNKKTSVPSQIKMKHGNKWYTISVRDFSAKNLPNSLFTFNSKDYPSAEVIDLR